MKISKAPSSLVESLTSCANRIICSVIILATLVALAPLLPLSIRHQTLVGALVMWFVTTIGGSASTAIRAIQQVRDAPNRYLFAITFVGISLALLAVTQLEIIRIAADRPALIWNVEWRYSLNHAQAIAQTGGVNYSLDYFGAPIDYHVGPAWLAAAVQRVFGAGVGLTLFGIIPLLSIVTIVIVVIHILDQYNVPLHIGAAATALTLTIPSLGKSLLKFLFHLNRGIFDCDYWIFSSSFMLNSIFALCVGLACFTFLINKSSKWKPAIGAIGLSSLVALKPQYFVALGLVAGLVGITEQIRIRDLSLYKNRILASSLLSLCCALTFMTILPSEQSIFGSPILMPGETGYALLTELFKGSTFLLIIGLIGWYKLRSASSINGGSIQGSRLLTYSLFTMAIIVIFLFLVCIPIREQAAEKMRQLGLIDFSEKKLQGDMGFGQALTPLRILLSVASISLLFRFLLGRSGTLCRIVMVIASICVISPLAFISLGFVEPLRGYEAVDDFDLYRILQHIPRSGTLLISSDLADPAQDYKRSASAFCLTAYGGHSFYVANFRYFNFARDDSVARAENLRAFFGSPWSDWHSQWLARNGITHVLTNDRCVPCWEESRHFGLKNVVTVGRWTLYELPARTAAHDPLGGDGFPPFTDMRPKYGMADCLLIKRSAIRP
jgi:hypothetical protein